MRVKEQTDGIVALPKAIPKKYAPGQTKDRGEDGENAVLRNGWYR